MHAFFHAQAASRRHPAVVQALTLLQGPAARKKAGAYLAEGIKVIREAVLARAELLKVFVSPRLRGEAGGTALLSLLRKRPIDLLPVQDQLLELLAHTRSPQGITAMIRLPDLPDTPPPPRAGYPLLVTWKVQDPGNMGSLVRTAEALGVSGVMVAGGGTDPYHPRAVRAASGSLFRVIPICPPGKAPLVEPLKKAGYRLLAAVPQHGRTAASVNWNLPWALLLGAEGSGLPARLVQRAAARVSIPMAGKVESLSVPAAAAALLYEAARTRTSKKVRGPSRDARPARQKPSSRTDTDSKAPARAPGRPPTGGRARPAHAAPRTPSSRPGQRRSSGGKRPPAPAPSRRRRKAPGAT